MTIFNDLLNIKSIIPYLVDRRSVQNTNKAWLSVSLYKYVQYADIVYSLTFMLQRNTSLIPTQIYGEITLFPIDCVIIKH